MKSILKSTGLLMLLGLFVFVSCKKDDEPTPAGDPIATFTYTIGTDNFLSVSFNSAGAQNAETFAWAFGDGEVSTEANPTHVYTAVGEYTASLVVTNADGVESNTFTQTFTLTDPNEALKLLTGDVSKTWVLIRDGSLGMSLGSGPDAPAAYWPGSSNDGKRACLYYQEFTFALDGTYTFDDKGQFWAEFGIFNGVDGCDQNTTAEGCFEAVAANMVNECGDDVSAWLSGTHTFTYTASTGKVVLNGDGAWIGIPKLDEAAGYRTTPGASTTFTIDEIIPDDGAKGYDQMNAHILIGGDYWDFTYAHYTGTAPDVVDDFVPPACDPEVAISPTIISHSFASNDAAEWDLMQPTESGSTLELSVANPDAVDAGTTPLVGKYIRVADVPYQELQFKLSPVNAINFENMTTITMDVYLPGTNDYSGPLTDNVFIGFGATKCQDVQFWYENNIEHQATGIAKDQWVTLTLELATPEFTQGQPDGVTNVYGRNDFDMIYINFGGGNHGVGAEMYMKNFVIQ